MAEKPLHEFGQRRPAPLAPIPAAPAKRSGHVALLVMGTIAVGSAAYTLMPSESCQQTSPGTATSTECQSRSSSGGHGGSGGGSSSRSSYYSSDSSSSHSSAGTSSDSGSSHVTRGGFGSFAHAFGFSGG
jgi:hypothetical protein